MAFNANGFTAVAVDWNTFYVKMTKQWKKLCCLKYQFVILEFTEVCIYSLILKFSKLYSIL